MIRPGVEGPGGWALPQLSLIALALAFASPTQVLCQEALVLSGGGARGLAHAGVITGMEELGYDPDLVVGTSMGAVVGALYAAGYTPEEIAARIAEVDWAEVFLPTPLVVGPDRAVRYPLISLDLQVEELRFARGLVGQWRINRALAHLLFDANARARGDFDRLARRYRAVAADLTTGEAVVLGEGDLALAARASMAVPGIFAPVVWNGRVLVDGGIVDNLPTGVARALGAARVVGVDVGRPSAVIHDQSPLGVIQRALDLMQENTQRDPVPVDDLVLPELDPGLGGANFPADPTAVFAIGREAALRDLPVVPARAAGIRPIPAPPESFTRLLVEAPDSALAALARRVFEDVAPGPYDPDDVRVAVDRLYTTGLLEAVWPSVVEDGGPGEAALLIRLDAPPRVSLSGAAGYENDRGGRAWISLSRYTSTRDRPMILSAAASTNGIERWASLSTQLYARNRSALSMSVGAHARQMDIRFFAEDALGRREVLRLGGWAALELPLILQDQISTASMKVDWIDVEGGAGGISYGPSIRFSRLRPEDAIIGTPFLAEAEHRFGSVAYSSIGLRASRVLEAGPLRVAPIADFRWTSAAAPDDVRPALGDEHAIPGLRWGQSRGRSRTILGIDGVMPTRGVHTRVRARTGALTDDLARFDDAVWVSGAQIGFVWRNPVGTLEVGYGMNTLGGRRVEVNLGRGF